jgi:Flp pilus assembly pilin Flp
VSLVVAADAGLIGAAFGGVSPTEAAMITTMRERVRDESGQTMAEYAVVLAVITIAVVVTLGFLSSAISTQLNSVIGIL